MDLNSNSPCKECKDAGVQPPPVAGVEHMRQHLAERDDHIISLEADLIKCTTKINGLDEQVATWREKYERLYDSHKRVQKLNQNLEDKLLQMVDKTKNEKSQLTKDIATLSLRLAESKHGYSLLQKENERYKNDMNLAIQLLQCKPDNFVSQKLDNLPADTQARVSQYVMSKTKASSPTTRNGNEVETFDASEYEFNISASLMSKILEDSIQDTVTKHCDNCSCSKTQSKPFCYNESHYSVATQTYLSGEMKNSFCLNCNAEIKPAAAAYPASNGVKIINDKIPYIRSRPMYIIPQPVKHLSVKEAESSTTISTPNSIKENVKTAEVKKEDVGSATKANEVVVEPALHHKLCERIKTPTSSKNESVASCSVNEICIKDVKPNNGAQIAESNRKHSESSMGAISRSSSVAKSTTSTHKSNTHVGPGPRFCSLRMQAGTKNILLDNAQPDVPPILYKRQSSFSENPILKDLNDEMDHFTEDKIDEVDSDNNNKTSDVPDASVVLQIEDIKETVAVSCEIKNVNQTLVDIVPSSPLELNTPEANAICKSEITKLLDLTHAGNDIHLDNKSRDTEVRELTSSKEDLLSPPGDHTVKLFNFDRYEQHKFGRHLTKIDMSQYNYLENTKISKDMSPQGDYPKAARKFDVPMGYQGVVNVYPNLSQTHLKVNELQELSNSSLSSDDSSAILQKQQLLRVAEWVEKNLEQQNDINDPVVVEEDVLYNGKTTSKDVPKIVDNLNQLALNMPHPVSKFSQSYVDEKKANTPEPKNTSQPQSRNGTVISSIEKETVIPVENTGETADAKEKTDENNETKAADEKLTKEEMARIEYNVKKFLLSGPYWIKQDEGNRERRTSSKTETEV